MAYTAQPVGMLATLFEQIHQYSNEPRIKAKYPTNTLYPLIKANTKEAINELVRMSDTPPLVQFQITVTNDTTTHVLPSNVGSIERIFEVDTTTGLPKEEYFNSSRKNISGPGFRIEGTNTNVLRWLPKWTRGNKTLVIEYIPNGNVEFAFGTINPTSGGFSTTTAKLHTSPDEGYFDRRPNAYLGAIWRALTASHNPSGFNFWPITERLITGYTASGSNSPYVTFDAALDFDPSAISSITSITYEIVPDGFEDLIPVVAMRTAMTLHRLEGNTKRAENLKPEYLSKMRDLRLNTSARDMIRGPRHEHDIASAQIAQDYIY